MCILADHEATTTPRNVDLLNDQLRQRGVWAPLSPESERVAHGDTIVPAHRLNHTGTLTREQVLRQLQHGPQTAKEVAHRIGRAASTTTAALRELAADGLIEPDRPAKSGRSARWSLT